MQHCFPLHCQEMSTDTDESTSSSLILTRSPPSSSSSQEFEQLHSSETTESLQNQDRPTKILQAYPCFRELDHLMDELQRILNRGNSHFPRLRD
ncbi:unnamed protein product [Arctogadus glacialis]